MSTWLAKMLQDTGFSIPESDGFEESTTTSTSIAPNTSAAEASPAAVAVPVVSDRRRRRRRRDEQGTRRRDRDRRRQEEDDAALARRLAAEDEPEDDADRDTVACRACGQRLAASVDAIEAHSLHCSSDTSEAWAHAAARSREDPDGLVGGRS